MLRPLNIQPRSAFLDLKRTGRGIDRERRFSPTTSPQSKQPPSAITIVAAGLLDRSCFLLIVPSN
ncbi:hypothetical protein U9M48_044748 [Paspalum notatum var. saurae]|uniref:Uncharacterized protein n=1 Tax=Paspalum notatum var. saurae TaxID=547442 RepID=A0AAQ3UXI9_PASNO